MADKVIVLSGRLVTQCGLFLIGVIATSVLLPERHAVAADAEIDAAVKQVATTDGTPSADQSASQFAMQLSKLPSDQVTEVLDGFSVASTRGRNWLRSIAADVSDNGPFPKSELLAYFNDRSHDPDARYVCFQLLTQNDPDLVESLLEDAADDPSLPIRFLTIQAMIKSASAEMKSDPEKAKRILNAVVENGRSPAQLETAAKLLSELNAPIDLASELGMIRQWWLIGPFDNTDSAEFDTAYVPENRYLETGSPINQDASGNAKPEKGKRDTVEWQKISSDDSLGMVDLNEPLGNEKDATAYVFARLNIDDDLPEGGVAQIRIGCITANKVWVNGKLVSENEVYHSGTRIDQYIDNCKLVPGENTVLIKVLQNAQTQPWAQDWQFQFRLTRPDGSPIEATVKP